MEYMRRILVVDDNESIHHDIESILQFPIKKVDNELLQLEAGLFEEDSAIHDGNNIHYTIDHAFQGEEAIKMVQSAAEAGSPFAMLFMDVRMPPGIDGVEAIQRIWHDYPNTEMVICTAFSDYSWEDIITRLGTTDKLQFMRKPFDSVSLRQTALSLTTKWKLQQDAVEYTLNLENEVRERTNRLNKLVEEYNALRIKAEDASKSKSAFLAIMGHEIRNPVSGIMGLNELLLASDLSEEQAELLGMIKYSTESLMRIINDVLDFSKIEAGKMELEEIEMDVREITSSVVRLLSVSPEKKPIDISCTFDDRIPEVLIGDPSRIRQILLNYGLNAYKFTSTGSISVDVELVEEDGSFTRLKFSVTDTGCGIPQEKQQYLFTPFSQLDSSIARNFGGSGLGLSICKQLTELMGGEVGLESKVDQGSRFWFSVPLKKG